MRRLTSMVRDESGVALILALVMMLVLTIGIATALDLSSSGSRHATRVNAGQKAYSLAEAGVNNAVSVLEANYPADRLPGRIRAPPLPHDDVRRRDGDLERIVGGDLDRYAVALPVDDHVDRDGEQPDRPDRVAVRRTATAAVPVVIPQTEPAGSGNVLNWIYTLGNISFGQSVTVATPVYTTGNLVMSNSATISSARGVIAVAGNVTLATQNSIGTSASRIPLAYVHGSCQYKNNPVHSPCQWDTDNIFAAGPGAGNTGGTTIPAGLLAQTPTLTCCAVPSSQMGFWYRYASPGPYFPCVTSSGSAFLPQFDSDLVLNNSANSSAAVNLTPSGDAYSCTTDERHRSQWDGSSPVSPSAATIYIDGSAFISAGSGRPTTGTGTIIAVGHLLDGEQHADVLRMPRCTDGRLESEHDGSRDRRRRRRSGVLRPVAGERAGDSIDIKKGKFQGVLIGNKSIDTSVSGTLIVGPMISVNGAVSAGQSGTFSFPRSRFAPSGVRRDHPAAAAAGSCSRR